MKKLLILFSLIVIIACGSSGNKQEGSKEADSNVAGKNENVNNEATNADAPDEEEASIAGDGEKVYKQYCMACHQANGQGVQGMYPTLIGTDYVVGDKERLIGIILNGMEGEIEVKGETFNNIMPSHNFLSDQEVADVLTYIRQMGENDASEVTPDEVKSVRDA